MALAVAALVASLLAPAAIAKKTPYVGPLLGPPQQDTGSSVEFKLVSKGEDGKRPVAIKKFFYAFLNVDCNSASGPEPTRFSAIRGGPRVPVKKRKFEYSDSFADSSGGTFSFEVQGRIPRKGAATGTIRVTGSYVLPDSGTVTCNSTVSWEARVDTSPF
jgi:hypothetical protein